MKKNIFVFLIIFSGVMCFARPILQLDADGCGLYTIYNKSAFDNVDAPSVKNSFISFSGLTGSLIWEFGKANPQKIHYFAGVTAGIEGGGFPLAAMGGFNMKLMDLGPLNMELSSALNIGSCSGVKGGVEGYGKISSDVIFMGQSRRGFYGGIGIVDYITPNLNYYVDYGLSIHFINNLSLHAVAGLRF